MEHKRHGAGFGPPEAQLAHADGHPAHTHVRHKHDLSPRQHLRLFTGWAVLIAGVVLGLAGAATGTNTQLLWGASLIFLGGAIAGSPVIWDYFN